MAGVKLLDLEGRRVVLISLANCNQDETVALCAEAAALVQSQPPKSVITITQVEGTHFSPLTVKAVRDMAVGNDPFVQVGIVVGVTGVRKTVFETILRLTHRRLLAFESMDQAKAWLQGRFRGNTGEAAFEQESPS